MLEKFLSLEPINLAVWADLVRSTTPGPFSMATQEMSPEQESR